MTKHIWNQHIWNPPIFNSGSLIIQNTYQDNFIFQLEIWWRREKLVLGSEKIEFSFLDGASPDYS